MMSSQHELKMFRPQATSHYTETQEVVMMLMLSPVGTGGQKVAAG